MIKKIKFKVKVRAYDAVQGALEYAARRGVMRHNKYMENQIDEASEDLLCKEIEDSFWLYMEEHGYELL
jgi:hypothetical protein